MFRELPFQNNYAVNSNTHMLLAVAGHLVLAAINLRYLPSRGDIHGAMAAVSGHGSPTGALQRHHSLDRDITGSPSRKPDQLTLDSRGTVHG